MVPHIIPSGQLRVHVSHVMHSGGECAVASLRLSIADGGRRSPGRVLAVTTGSRQSIRVLVCGCLRCRLWHCRSFWLSLCADDIDVYASINDWYEGENPWLTLTAATTTRL